MKTIIMLPRCQTVGVSTACASDLARVGDEFTRLTRAIPPSAARSHSGPVPANRPFRIPQPAPTRCRWSAIRLGFTRHPSPSAVFALRLLPLLLLLAQLALVPRVAAQNNNRPTGTVVSWGSQVIPEVAPGTRFTSIAAGRDHTLALKTDGTVVGWGYDGAGQSTVPAGLTGVFALAAGGNSSLALVADAPALAVQASGDNLLLSWPLWAQGFGLQATPNLADENSWTPVLTVPVVAGSQNRVTEPIASPAKFYRLKK